MARWLAVMLVGVAIHARADVSGSPMSYAVPTPDGRHVLVALAPGGRGELDRQYRGIVLALPLVAVAWAWTSRRRKRRAAA